MSTDPEDLLKSLNEPVSNTVKLILIWIAGLGLFILLALFTYGLIHLGEVSTRVDHNQQSNTKALCAFRADLQSRVTSGNKFLKDHPKGIPGISPTLIRTSIKNEQSTINSLSSLVCPKKTK